MSGIDDLTEHLSDLLDRKNIERNDFIALVVIGEAHRQSLALSGQTRPADAEVHERWLARLKEIAADAERTWKVTSGELDEDLNAVWLELKAAVDKRDFEACADAFDEVEQVMAVATTCARMGWLQVEEIQVMADRAELEAGQLAPELPELWDYAYRRYTTTLPDPEYPQAHAWIEALARLSPVRTALVSASRLYSPKKRAEMVERVVNRIAPQHSDPVDDLVDRIAALLLVVAGLRARATGRLRVAFAAGEAAVRGSIDGVPALATVSPTDRITADTMFSLTVHQAPGGLEGRRVRLLLEGAGAPPLLLAEGPFVDQETARLKILGPAGSTHSAEIPKDVVVELAAELHFEVV
jgi:hypothetical protein